MSEDLKTAQEHRVYTVSEITKDIRAVLEQRFQGVWIEGEVSGSKMHSSGHIYFSMKDESSLLNSPWTYLPLLKPHILLPVHLHREQNSIPPHFHFAAHPNSTRSGKESPPDHRNETSILRGIKSPSCFLCSSSFHKM